MAQSILNVKQINKTYPSSSQPVHALKNVDLAVHSGDLIAILGRSGSGKSTLLNVLGGLMPPDSGEVFLGAESIYDLSEKRRASIRSSRIGFIFQSFNLVDELTALHNIRLPQDIAGKKLDPEKESKIITLLDIEDRMKFYPDQLSGGERQRVAIARALLMEPDIILADEPTGNLDSLTGHAFREIVLESNRLGQTFIIVTHDEGWTNVASRHCRMADGVLTELSRL